MKRLQTIAFSVRYFCEKLYCVIIGTLFYKPITCDVCKKCKVVTGNVVRDKLVVHYFCLDKYGLSIVGYPRKCYVKRKKYRGYKE